MRRAVALAAAVAALAAAPALADEQVVAGPGQRYLTTTVTIDQGQRLSFANRDVTSHDVTARTNAPDGRPLFSTPTVGSGGQAPVEGTQYLTTGSYEFFCSIHPGMQGTLNVTSAGTPASRPPGDSRAPGVSLALKPGLRPAKLARSGKLGVRVKVDEGAAVELTGKLRVRGRDYALRAVERRLTGGRTTTLNLRLGKAARSAASDAPSARVRIAASARDDAGNSGSSSLKRKLRS